MRPDHVGRFSTELFERYQRSKKALAGTLAKMSVQGVSTRKGKAVTEALWGHGFPASSIGAINKTLDCSLKAYAERRLGEAYPYLVLDARSERVREGGVIASQAGRNGRHALAGLFWQSVFGRLAGYADVNGAKRLRHDAAVA